MRLIGVDGPVNDGDGLAVGSVAVGQDPVVHSEIF